MERAPIPNDIIQEIINALAQSATDSTGLSHVKKFSTLSSFCLQQVRKHVFAQVRLCTSPRYNGHNPILETLDSQVAFFTTHKGPLLHIRRLILDMSNGEMKDEALQIRLHDVLVQLTRLVAFEVYNHGIFHFPVHHIAQTPRWSELAPKSARSALQTLFCTSSNLSEVHLWRVPGFPISDLQLMTNLRHLRLIATPLFNDFEDGIVARPPKHVRLEDLESLEINGYERGKSQTLRKLLLTRDSDGELLLSFSKLKSLTFEVYEVSTFHDVIELLKIQGSSHLEDLKCVISMENSEGDNNYSEWLNKIILPLNATLQKLTATAHVATATQDPFGGLCSTLGRMSDSNILTSLALDVTIETDCPCMTGGEWIALTEALTRTRQWISLREVNLTVELFDFGRPDDSLQRALEALRETHLKPLFSMPFKFQYNVERYIV